MNTQIDASRISVKRLRCRLRCASSRTEQMYVNIEMDKIVIEMNKRSAINGIRGVWQINRMAPIYAGTWMPYG